MEKVTDLTARLAAPIVEEQGCSLWDVEYVKEAGTWYLRVLIDKEGGVDILDCEAISREASATCWTRRTPLRAATPWR